MATVGVKGLMNCEESSYYNDNKGGAIYAIKSLGLS